VNKRDLKRKIRDIQQSNQVGDAARREAERKARVIAELEAIEEGRDKEDAKYGDGLSPIERARRDGDTEAIAEYEALVALIEERRATRPRWGEGNT
jgi:hypothetical protein